MGRRKTERSIPVDRQDAQRLLWDAINKYVKSCGGDPSKHIYGNTPRMDAVVMIKRYAEQLQPHPPLAEDIEHVGKSAKRTKRDLNIMERIFAEVWAERNDACIGCPHPYGTLDYLLAEDPSNPRNEVLQRDATVAATVIQWLGSEEGMLFLVDVFTQGLKNKLASGFAGFFVKRVIEQGLCLKEAKVFKSWFSQHYSNLEMYAELGVGV
jgi:hypothetical protein